MAFPADRRVPAVFLDRDGVLNEDHGYVHQVERLVVLPGVPEALTELARRGFRLVVITNQSGVARGYFSEAAVHRFNEALAAAIIQAGGPRLDGFYVCPHHPQGEVTTYRLACGCRKPAPGLVLQAQSELGLDLERSYLIGDKADDVECAVRAGVTGIQVAGAYPDRHPRARAIVPSLAAALPHIAGAPLG